MVQPGFSPINLSQQQLGDTSKFSFSTMDSPSSVGQYSQFGMGGGGSSNARPSPQGSGGLPPQPPPPPPFYGNTLPPLTGNNPSSVAFSPATQEMISQAVAASANLPGGQQHMPPGRDDVDMQAGGGSNVFDEMAAAGPSNPGLVGRNRGVTFADNGQGHPVGGPYSTRRAQMDFKEEPMTDWPDLAAASTNGHQQHQHQHRQDDDPGSSPPRKFPKFHGFAPPPHRYAQYGIVVPSTAPSSEDESEDTLPRSTLDAPIEALQALANAADQAAQDERAAQTSGFLSPPRCVKRGFLAHQGRRLTSLASRVWLPQSIAGEVEDA
jgi:hypothetical protein